MKFEINGKQFIIKEVEQNKLMEYKQDTEGYFYGQTHFQTQEIWIDKELTKEQKRRTLYHELMHCYIVSYITTQDLTYEEELLCDISANSHDIIHKIVEDYFKEVLYE